MRRLFIVLAFLICLPTYSSDMIDVDYNFIDTAFEGIKPVTDKEFNDTINRLTPQPVDDSFGGKVKAFLFGRKYGVQAPSEIQNKNIDTGGEVKAIQEIKNGIHFIRIPVSVIADGGNIIPLGDYKIQEKTVEADKLLVFYQGSKEYGKLKLKPFEDNLKGENDINYARVDIISDDVVRIVYSTLTDTKCAYARILDNN